MLKIANQGSLLGLIHRDITSNLNKKENEGVYEF